LPFNIHIYETCVGNVIKLAFGEIYYITILEGVS